MIASVDQASWTINVCSHFSEVRAALKPKQLCIWCEQCHFPYISRCNEIIARSLHATSMPFKSNAYIMRHIIYRKVWTE